MICEMILSFILVEDRIVGGKLLRNQHSACVSVSNDLNKISNHFLKNANKNNYIPKNSWVRQNFLQYFGTVRNFSAAALFEEIMKVTNHTELGDAELA